MQINTKEKASSSLTIDSEESPKMRYPNIKFDFSPPSYQININPEKNHQEKNLTKFDKLLIESFIQKYDILMIDNKTILKGEENKSEFLMKNHAFLEEMKHEIIKSKKFALKNAAFLAANENDKQFLFHKLVFCIQKQIKYFILNFSKYNQMDFAFLKMNKHQKIIFDDSKSKKNHINEQEYHEMVDYLMKNANFSSKETQFLKKILSKIPPQAIKSHLEVINSVDAVIEEKQSFKFFFIFIYSFKKNRDPVMFFKLHQKIRKSTLRDKRYNYRF